MLPARVQPPAALSPAGARASTASAAAFATSPGPRAPLGPARAALAALAAAALLTACTPGYDACFDPQAVIRSPQVLAVRADPPEVLYAPGDPAPLVRLRALVALPDFRGAPIDVQVRLCSPSLRGRCDDSFPPAASVTTDTENVDVDGVRVPPEVIARALADDPLHGYGGIRVLADLAITGAPGSDLALRAGKVLLFSPHGTVPNQAIEIDSLLVGGKARQSVVLQQAGSVLAYISDPVLPFEQRRDVLWLTPNLHRGSVEEYDVTDLGGRRVHLIDNVTYNFHASLHFYFGDPQKLEINGGFSSWSEVEGGDVAAEPLPGLPPPSDGLVHLRTFKANPLGRVWIVARDTRGAEAWFWIYVSSADTRCCNPEASCDGSTPNGCPLLQEPICDFSDIQKANSAGR